MASADATGSISGTSFGGLGMEAVEPRRLFAITPVGAPGVLAATGVTAVESATASPDTTNNFRYASYVTGSTAAFVAPVNGSDSSTPGMSIPLTIPAGGTVSNTDVAANAPADTVVVVYEVTVTTPGSPGSPGTPGTPAGSDSNIYAALYANGTLVGSAVQVNTSVTGNQTNCRVAMDGSGNFIVVWESSVSGAGLEGRRFNADGSPRGTEFTISSSGVEPDVAANASGAFAITYSGGSGAFAQLYTANGSVNGSAVQINSEPFTEPAIGLTNNGRFVVAWATGSGIGRKVVAQQYSAQGVPTAAVFNASTSTLNSQTAPELAVDTAGGFAIGWAQASTGTAYDQAAFRIFRGNGVAAGPETVISGVAYLSDHRFGLAYRVPGLIHIAYATTAGEALMQTYSDDAAGNGSLEDPVPNGALLIDLTAQTPGVTLDVAENGNTITVTINGTSTNYNRSSYSSIYVRGTAGNDLLDLNSDVTLPAIVYARAGADTVYGTSAGDRIDGGDGGQVPTGQVDFLGNPITVEQGNQIQARGGDDYVYGGANNDTVFGDTGNDRLLGGPGVNVVYGEADSDTIVGGNRRDGLFGGDGNDSLLGNDGGDYLDGGAGDDSLDGGDGNDRLFGNNGDDQLEGGAGPDNLHGGRGTDRLFGNDGRDTLSGDNGADYLRGGGVGDGFGNGGVAGQYDIYYYDLLDTLQGQATRIAVR